MRIAVTGTTGRVGAALVRHLAPHHEIIPLPRRICDLADTVSLKNALARTECEVFINPAGLTSLEACEDDPALAKRVNAEAPGEIETWASARGVLVFHFSTDYVFSGATPDLRTESETPAPVSEYARSKLAGEHAILRNPENCVIRIAWVFGPEKPSFVDHQFDAALEGRPLAAVADKFSLPVYTRDLAIWIERLIHLKTSGIVHACNSGESVTWHWLATAVAEEMVACGALGAFPAIRSQALEEIASFRAKRPRFTAMDTRRLTEILGHTPRSWRDALAEYVRGRCSAC